LTKKRINKYEKGFDILMEFWDVIPEGEREIIDRRLRKLGI